MATIRERNAYELVYRERKAASLAITLVKLGVSGPEPMTSQQLQVATRDPGVRASLSNKCGYNHVSEETWERVAELVVL